jgi:CheY-like chemotaxis protein
MRKARRWHALRSGHLVLTPSSHRHGRVLIVEDDESVRRLAEMVLTRAGYDVRAAGNPNDALTLLGADPSVDVVLTDIVLPEMTGYDFADEAHRFSPAARIVFMSGNNSDQLKRGVDEIFLAKPFTLTSLRTVISQAVAA